MALANPARSDDLRLETDLRGKWRFELGDAGEYAEPGYDDGDWEKITVPGCWEDHGFPGYDGFAWYRTRFEVDPSLLERSLYLLLGHVDDVDQVYINGRFLNGSGSLPPEYQTAFNQARTYFLPSAFLKKRGSNLLAVRVYDATGCGGISAGKIGIYSKERLPLHTDLSGDWKFKLGDHPRWSRSDLDDSKWDKIFIPSSWESRGFPNYDGFAWYRKRIRFGANSGQKHILVLGKIDDIDEVYLNGERIGGTGQIADDVQPQANHYSDSYKQERFYYLPPHLIRWNAENVVAVRVFDYWLEGGIYDGPVGLITREDYMRYHRID